MKVINLSVPTKFYNALESNAARSKKTIQELLNDSIEYFYKLELEIDLQNRFEKIVIKHLDANIELWKYCRHHCKYVIGKLNKNKNNERFFDLSISQLVHEGTSISYMSEAELSSNIYGWELEKIGSVGNNPVFYAVGRGYYFLHLKESGLTIEVSATYPVEPIADY
ncbi:hypothetical protein BCQ47_21520 [Salmonella enterica subsp. enterica serovar Schwarzengrund]|nr:hypothetical protein [Salmonella enterica subsp. enterica serovar Schwarzengrund]